MELGMLSFHKQDWHDYHKPVNDLSQALEQLVIQTTEWREFSRR